MSSALIAEWSLRTVGKKNKNFQDKAGKFIKLNFQNRLPGWKIEFDFYKNF